MAKLSQLGIAIKASQPIVFVSFDETQALTRDGNPYIKGVLLNPISVTSSMEDDPDIKTIPDVEELFIRQEDFDQLDEMDAWEAVEGGVRIRSDIKGWRADFTIGTLKSEAPVIFQHGSIREWAKGQRKLEREEWNSKRKESASEIVRKMQERRRKK